jgi:hypothetical protein
LGAAEALQAPQDKGQFHFVELFHKLQPSDFGQQSSIFLTGRAQDNGWRRAEAGHFGIRMTPPT